MGDVGHGQRAGLCPLGHSSLYLCNWLQRWQWWQLDDMRITCTELCLITTISIPTFSYFIGQLIMSKYGRYVPSQKHIFNSFGNRRTAFSAIVTQLTYDTCVFRYFWVCSSLVSWQFTCQNHWRGHWHLELQFMSSQVKSSMCLELKSASTVVLSSLSMLVCIILSLAVFSCEFSVRLLQFFNHLLVSYVCIVEFNLPLDTV